MESRLRFRPLSSVVLCAAFSSVMFAQTAAPPAQKASSGGGEDEFPDIVEIDPFGGINTAGQVHLSLTTHQVTGGVAGIRVAVNPAKYFGIEGFFYFAQANVEFRSSSGVYPPGNGALTGTPLPTYSFGSRNYYFGLNPVLNLRPRGSKVQP